MSSTTAPQPVSSGGKSSISPWVWSITICLYLAGLLGIGWYFRNALNTDAVAYLRIASYYTGGNLDLAVSGYWGPLLSWLMVLPLKAGLFSLVAARLAMGISALVFLGGCVAVFGAFELPPKWVLTGAILSAACGLYWSVRFITPDLLLAGLVGLAASRTLKRETNVCLSNDLVAGGFWGLAYLAKAVAFPLALLSTLGLAALSYGEKTTSRHLCLRRTLSTLIGFGLIAGPWVLILSLRYGQPTISTSARISHAITGPADVERYHPFAQSLHKPAAGRVTTWEDPSRMAYRYWSPFHSSAYALHQLKVLAQNIPICLILLTSLEVAWLVPGLHWILQSGPNSSRQLQLKYLRVFLVPILLFVLYLPTSVNLAEQRFFYPAFAFLFAAIAIAATDRPQDHVLPKPIRIWWLGTLGAAAPLLAIIAFHGDSPKYAGDCAADLARRIERANLAGPVAGSAMLPGGRAGLYVAFLLNQPWYGDEPNPTPLSFVNSGARLVMVPRRSKLAQELSQSPQLANADAMLFDDPGQAAGFPVQVYQVKRWEKAASR